MVKYTCIFGVQNTVYNEGTQFVIPLFETPIIYNVRAKPLNIASLTDTKDNTNKQRKGGRHDLNFFYRFANDQHYFSCTFKVSRRLA